MKSTLFFSKFGLLSVIICLHFRFFFNANNDQWCLFSGFFFSQFLQLTEMFVRHVHVPNTESRNSRRFNNSVRRVHILYLHTMARGPGPSRLPLLNPCFTSQRYELWVVPSGKVCRNADLQKMCIKGSESLRESPRALDDLTVGQPYVLPDLAETCLSLRVRECGHWGWAHWAEYQHLNVPASLNASAGRANKFNVKRF